MQNKLSDTALLYRSGSGLSHWSHVSDALPHPLAPVASCFTVHSACHAEGCCGIFLSVFQLVLF